MKKVILKISGEALKKDVPISSQGLSFIEREIRSLIDNNILPLIVLGGGNIYRGRKNLFTRVKGDQLGMLATIMNGIALTDYLNKNNIKTKFLTSIEMNRIATLFSTDTANEYISKKYVIVFGGGTANPFFSTDSLAALRASELNVNLILKGSTVDGIYDKDPKKHKNAKQYNKLTFQEILKKDIGVIFDHAAFHLAQESKTELVVYDFFKKGNTLKAFNKKIGTYVKWGK
ncbi:UMP kinase [bacterium]|nr:UMP kinase [bacterium]